MKIISLISMLFIAIGSLFFWNNSKKNTAPTKRSEMASTFLDGKIYVAGGINFWGSNNSFEAYDIASDQLESLPELPKKLNHIGLAVYQDINEKQWDVLGKMPAKRGAHVMIQRDQYLHLIGGRNHKAIWSFNLKTQKWETDKIAPLPEKRDHISVLQDDKKLYVVGGRQSGIVREACWEYDFENVEWNIFATLKTWSGTYLQRCLCLAEDNRLAY